MKYTQLFQKIAWSIRGTLYQISPETYGWIFLGIALMLIVSSITDLASIMSDLISNEEVESFW
jgi:hypothetical protein